jgi:hypothetical protein
MLSVIAFIMSVQIEAQIEAQITVIHTYKSLGSRVILTNSTDSKFYVQSVTVMESGRWIREVFLIDPAIEKYELPTRIDVNDKYADLLYVTEDGVIKYHDYYSSPSSKFSATKGVACAVYLDYSTFTPIVYPGESTAWTLRVPYLVSCWDYSDQLSQIALLKGGDGSLGADARDKFSYIRRVDKTGIPSSQDLTLNIINNIGAAQLHSTEVNLSKDVLGKPISIQYINDTEILLSTLEYLNSDGIIAGPNRTKVRLFVINTGSGKCSLLKEFNKSNGTGKFRAALAGKYILICVDANQLSLIEVKGNGNG